MGYSEPYCDGASCNNGCVLEERCCQLCGKEFVSENSDDADNEIVIGKKIGARKCLESGCEHWVCTPCYNEAAGQMVGGSKRQRKSNSKYT